MSRKHIKISGRTIHPRKADDADNFVSVSVPPFPICDDPAQDLFDRLVEVAPPEGPMELYIEVTVDMLRKVLGEPC